MARIIAKRGFDGSVLLLRRFFPIVLYDPLRTLSQSPNRQIAKSSMIRLAGSTLTNPSFQTPPRTIR